MKNQLIMKMLIKLIKLVIWILLSNLSPSKLNIININFRSIKINRPSLCLTFSDPDVEVINGSKEVEI